MPTPEEIEAAKEHIEELARTNDKALIEERARQTREKAEREQNG